ncbi:MAG: hypothetical protein HY900_25660 [Deltaproteobacteria bacterium]|nr:hypothetical protein [Deltaproteobacteria bacterium]
MAEVPGNPSTLYEAGRRAEEFFDASRARVARLGGVQDPFEAVFTSGGTEGDNEALIRRLPRPREEGRGCRVRDPAGVSDIGRRFVGRKAFVGSIQVLKIAEAVGAPRGA